MSKPQRKPAEKPGKKPKFHRTFVRQWRKKRGLTQEELADKVGMTGGNLSEIETGGTGYTQATLEALAAALECEPADLLTRDPNDPDPIWGLWHRATPNQRKQLVGMISGFLGAKT